MDNVTSRFNLIKKGFTLVEIMLVMAILAIILSTVTLASKPNVTRQLIQDGEYLGDVLDFMQQEAQIRGSSLIITIDKYGIKTNAKSNHNILNQYKWDLDSIYVNSGWIQDKYSNPKQNVWHRVITTEPIQTSFNLFLIKENKKIHLVGDGSGRYKISQVNDINE